MGNFFNSIFRRRESTESSSGKCCDKTASSSASYRDRAVYVYSDDMAMKISTVWSAVDLLSSTVAKLPLSYKRLNRSTKTFVEYDNSPLYWLLRCYPNDHMTAFDFWKTIVAQIKLHGNSYVYISRSGIDINEFILLTPYSVFYDAMTNTYSVIDRINGIVGTFDASEILHFKNISLDGGYTGVSTIRYAADVLSIQATGDKETLSRFAQGGRFKALFCNDNSIKGFGEYADEALREGADDIQKSLDSGKDIIAVPGDGKVQQLSMTSVDLQYLENRKFGVREICRFFRVPPSKIYDDFNNAYKTAEMSNEEFLTDSIDPILCAIEQELSRKLIPFELLNTYKFHFDRDKLFTTDLMTKANYQGKTIQNGVYTVNDWRRKEDLPPVEGGDVVYLSCNVAPINSPKITGEDKSGQPISDENSNE